MRTRLNRFLLSAACLTALFCLSSSAWSFDDASEEEAAQIEVVVEADSAADESEPAEADAVEVVVEAIAVDSGAPQSDASEAPEATTARLLLRLADENAPHILLRQPAPEQIRYRYRAIAAGGEPAIGGMPARGIWTASPGGLMLFSTAHPNLPQVLRIVTDAEGQQDGVFAFYYDPETGEQLSGDDVDAVGQWDGEYMIGVSLSEIDSELLRQHLGIDPGVALVIDQVFEGSPAQAVGLEVGDIILKVGDTDIKTAQELVDAVQAFATGSGDSITLEVIHAGERRTVDVTPTTRQELLGYDVVAAPESNELVWSTLLDPTGVNPHFDQLLVTPYSAYPVPQQDHLATSIQSLAEQVQRLQESIDRLEQQLNDE